MKTGFRHLIVAAILLATAGIATASAMGENALPPRELVQYVHEAKKRGIKEDKIRQQALAVGWPAATVDAAIAYDKTGKLPPAEPAESEKVGVLKSRPEPAEARPAAADVHAAPAETRPAPAEAHAAPAEAQPAPPDKIVSGASEAAIPNSFSGGARTTPEVPQEYQISPGDTLQISVWKEAEASVPNEIVRPDGKITVPLIKEVEVAGLTPKQVEAVVTERLDKFISDANVTVVVTAMAVKYIYVTGAVKKEGPVIYANGMTVLQALSEAGGLTDYAKRKKIYVLHTEGGSQYRYDFNYDEVLRGERMEQNIVLLPGDTVVVPH